MAVAFLVETNSHHAWAVERFHELPAPFLTYQPVLTETFYLPCLSDKRSRKLSAEFVSKIS